MPDNIEQKYFQHEIAFEIKEITTDEEFFYFEGYGSTDDLDLTRDIVEPTAFVNSLKKKMPIILWQHNRSEPIGIYETAEVQKNKGLFLRGKMPLADTFVKERVVPQLKIKSVKALSIGFYVKLSEYDRENDIRTIKEVDLHEVSLVTFPANPHAIITSLKSFLSGERVNEYTGRKYFPEKIAPIETPWKKEDSGQCLYLDHFPITDNSGKIIPRAVFIARATLSGAKSIPGGLSWDALDHCKSLINNLYNEMKLDSPFDEKGNPAPFCLTELKNLSKSNLAGVFRYCNTSKDASDYAASLFMTDDMVKTSDDLEELNESIESLKELFKN